MGARKIPIGMRNVTGYFYSFKNKRHEPYESITERDHFLSLEFLDEVLSYEAQPRRVPRNSNGKSRDIFPDCLVIFTRQSGKRPLLVEVKHTKDLNDPKKAKDIKRKLVAMEEFAKQQGWDFRLVTDQDIRGIRLENYRFLYKYTGPPAVFHEYGKTIMNKVIKNGPMTVTVLMEGLFPQKMERARALPCVWHLVRNGKLSTDLDKPLTNSSMVEVSNV
jgi:hypothetical protein